MESLLILLVILAGLVFLITFGAMAFTSWD